MPLVEMRNRSLLSLSGPIMLELLMLFMVPAVDAYYMSLISPEAVAAVSAVLPLTSVGFILFLPLIQAGSSVAAQHLGARNPDLARLTFSTMLGLSGFLGFLVSALLIGLADILPSFVGLDDSLSHLATLYIRMLGAGYTFLALKMASSGILNALGRTHINMGAALLMNALNLGLNHLFVTGALGMPELGVRGIALASSLAWLASFAFGLFFCRESIEKYSELKKKLDKIPETLKHILHIGLPSTLEPLSFQISQVMISRMLVQIGILTLTTKAYVANITLGSLIISAAFATATQIKVSHFLGAKAYDDAHRQLMEGLKLAFIGTTLVSLTLALSGQWILKIFTEDPECLRLGQRVLWVAVIMEWGRCLNVVAGACLRSSGDAKFVSFVGLSSMWTIAVLGSYILGISWGWGLMGVWLAMSLDEHTRGWASLWRWRTGQWRNKSVYR